MSPNRVPELSLADYLHGQPASRDAFSAQLLRGLQRYGFIVLRDHDVPAALLDEAYALSVAFFAQPEETKRRYVGGPRGYAPFRTEHAKNHAVPDLKELWQIGPERFDSTRDDPTSRPNIWPDSPFRFRETFVDSGDMLARMTNDVIPATTHRVVNPSGPNVSRYSMPFFMHPRPEVSLRALPSRMGAGARYPEITAGAFLEQRLREIGLIRSQ